MELCVYHENKMDFETLRRHLVRCKVFPRNLSKRLAMSVCSCRRKGTTKIELTNEDLVSMQESVRIFFNQSTEKPASICSLELIHNILHIDASLNTSEKYLVYILHRALERDFDVLEKERRPNWKNSVEIEKVNKNESDGKEYAMTQKQIKLMVKKRKRKMPVSSQITIPIPGKKLYLITRKTGRDLKDLAQKFRCYFEIDWSTINNNSSVGVPVTIKVWCRTKESLAQVKHYFAELMMTKDFMAYIVAGQEYALLNDGDNLNSRNRELKMNYCLTDHFTEKVLGRKKTNNRYVTSRQRVKSLPSALSSVFCERCLQSYSDVLVQNRACYFHLATRGSESEAETRRKWSCCDTEDLGHPLVEEHQNTGCWKGSHIWNTCDVISKPANHKVAPHSRSKQKLKWAVVGYVKAF